MNIYHKSNHTCFSTVGYGDTVPIRPLTKLFSIIIGMIGIVNTEIIITIAVTAGKKVIEHDGVIKNIKKKVKEELEDHIP